MTYHNIIFKLCGSHKTQIDSYKGHHKELILYLRVAQMSSLLWIRTSNILREFELLFNLSSFKESKEIA